MSESMHVEARFHPGDIHAEAGSDGIRLTMHGDEERIYAVFNWSAALTPGEGLVR